ncbi:hypothetical protein M501DRAFT_988311 [Patellaria atrata CBS 101060]|uniref:Uncharacterized protein n=1 Tax=Patellaria atrata CBS 101060 TaxID=1346257 RepID=A0A9P4SI65_9PEZI|nr:hypothetical protein M501DRAFT_988311 [Patellaria atrata CBS 101060]
MDDRQRENESHKHNKRKYGVLSEANVEQHNAVRQKFDTKYAEEMISLERTHQFNESMFNAMYHAKTDKLSGSKINSNSPSQPFAQFSSDLKLYSPPQASNNTPLQRQMIVSPMNEPLRWLARREMDDMNIEYGNMETAGKRARIAEIISSDANASHDFEPMDGRSSSPILGRPQSSELQTSSGELEVGSEVGDSDEPSGSLRRAGDVVPGSVRVTRAQRRRLRSSGVWKFMENLLRDLNFLKATKGVWDWYGKVLIRR